MTGTYSQTVVGQPTGSALQQRRFADVNEAAAKSLRSKVKSWYVGANIEGKPSVFMPYIGGLPAYIAKCDEVVEGGYKGFVRG